MISHKEIVRRGVGTVLIPDAELKMNGWMLVEALDLPYVTFKFNGEMSSHTNRLDYYNDPFPWHVEVDLTEEEEW